MDLLEHQGKRMLGRHGVPVPGGEVVGDVEKAVAAARRVGFPAVLKAQVRTGKRGKAGGIHVAEDAEGAREHASAMLGMRIGDHEVEELWVEPASEIAAELYASVLLDRGERTPLVLLSTRGGMDIEEIAESSPDEIARLHVDPMLGLEAFQGRELAKRAGVDADVIAPVGALLRALYAAFAAEEATLVEINPLAVTHDRELLALDAKVAIDDSALFRHADTEQLRRDHDESPIERDARERGLVYVGLDGDVGLLGNGAGLVMAMLDAVVDAGGEPASFLDTGGGATASAVRDAVEVTLAQSGLRAAFLNVIGGLTRCDDVAEGLVGALSDARTSVPFVVCLAGTNAEEGRRAVTEAGLDNVHLVDDGMVAAARRVVALSRGEDGAGGG